MKAATAFIELRADKARLKRDLDDVEGDVKKRATSTAAAFAQIFGAAAFGAAIKKSIDAASDLNETVSKTEQLFGAGANAVIEFSKSTARSMGLSQRAYLDASSELKGLLDNLGLAAGDATAWSQKLTQLGSDLGSFFNKDPAEAVEAIGSALRGESEPIRAFNVQINEAAIKTKALELGLYDGAGAIESNAKAQATLALIMAQTTAAQGDFARTADGAANSQRIAKAAAEDSAASLGQAFLPVYTRVVQVVTALAEGFGSLSAPVQVAVVALAGFVALGGPIGKIVDVAKAATTALGKMTTGGQVGFGLLAAAAGLALFALNQHLQEVERSNSFNKARVDLFTAALRDGASAAEAFDKALTDRGKLEFIDASDAQVKDFTATLVRAGINFDEFKSHLTGSKEEFQAWAFSIDTAGDAGSKMKLDDLNTLLQAGTQLMDNLATATRERAEQARAHGTALDGERHGLDRVRTASTDAKTAADDLAAATKEAARKSDVFAESLQRQIDKLADLYPKEYDAVQAKYDYADAQAAAMVAIDGLNKTLDDNEATQQDVDTATRNARDAILDQAEKYATLDGAALGSEGAIRRQIQSLEAQRDSLAPGSPLRAFLDQYISDLNSIPANISSTLKLRVSADATNAGAAGYVPRFGGGPTSEGGYFSRFQSRTIAEGNQPEAVLPLTKPSRLAALLDDPRIGGPVAAALGDQGSTGTTAVAAGPSGGNTFVIYGAERAWVMDLARQINNIRREGR